MFLLPAVSAIGGFHTRPEAENRAPADWPSSVAPHEAPWFDGVARSVEDRLGLVGLAALVASWVDHQLLGRVVSAEVIDGDDGWLYYRPSADAPCSDEVGFTREREVLRDLVAASGDLGLRLVVMVVPDKLAVEVDHLPAAFQDRAACLRERARRSEGVLRATLGQDALAMLDVMDAGDPGYFRDDTHWNATGRRLALRELVETLRPGTWDGQAVSTTVDLRDKDLLRLAGIPQSHHVEANRLEFGTIEDAASHPEVATLRSWTRNPVAGRALVESSTLVVHDSLVDLWPEEFSAPFADVRMIDWSELGTASSRTLLEGRETLVVELVGRSYWGGSNRVEELVRTLDEYAAATGP